MSNINVFLVIVFLRNMFCLVSLNAENKSGYLLRLGHTSDGEPISDIGASENITLFVPTPNTNDAIQSVSWSVFEDFQFPLWTEKTRNLGMRVHIMWIVPYDCDSYSGLSYKIWLQKHAKMVKLEDEWMWKGHEKIQLDKKFGKLMSSLVNEEDDSQLNNEDVFMEERYEDFIVRGYGLSRCELLITLSSIKKPSTKKITPPPTTTILPLQSKQVKEGPPYHFQNKTLTFGAIAGATVIITGVIISLTLYIKAKEPKVKMRPGIDKEQMRMYRSISHGGKNEEVMFDIGKMDFDEEELVDFFANKEEPKHKRGINILSKKKGRK